MIQRAGRWIAAALVALACLAGAGVLAGCSRGGGDDQPLAVASHYSGEDCDRLAEGTRQVRFADVHGTRLSGVEVGSGRVGIVLSHQDPGNVCDWLPWARETVLGNAGYRLLCLDFAGYGNSASAADGDTRDRNIVAAAGFLRAEGVATVLLMGASMGANAVLVAATELQPPPVGVISLSAPSSWKGLDAGEAVPKLAVPVLFVAGSGDNGGRFADDARALYAAAPTSLDRRLQIASSNSHGVNLLSPVDADASRTRAAVADFLSRYAPTGG
jgi:pimeloyl-ACP methyl ester carboxylesterase